MQKNLICCIDGTFQIIVNYHWIHSHLMSWILLEPLFPIFLINILQYRLHRPSQYKNIMFKTLLYFIANIRFAIWTSRCTRCAKLNDMQSKLHLNRRFKRIRFRDWSRRVNNDPQLMNFANGFIKNLLSAFHH